MLIIASSIFLAVAIYLIIKLSKSDDDDDDDNKQHDLDINGPGYHSHSEGNKNSSATMLMGLFTVIFMIMFAVGMYYSIKMSTERYKIAGQAIEKGDKGTAAAVLAPEIGEGVGYAAQGIGAAIWGRR